LRDTARTDEASENALTDDEADAKSWDTVVGMNSKMMSAISFHSNARPGAATIAPTIASNAGRHASAAPGVWEEEEFTFRGFGQANLPSWFFETRPVEMSF
jgi:hypothetical protein